MPRFFFAAHGQDGSTVRPDEGDARIFASFGKRRILRKKTKSRVDRVRTEFLGRFNDAANVEVAFCGLCGAKQNGFVRHANKT